MWLDQDLPNRFLIPLLSQFSPTHQRIFDAAEPLPAQHPCGEDWFRSGKDKEGIRSWDNSGLLSDGFRCIQGNKLGYF